MPQSIGTYYEPFAGSAAVFFAMDQARRERAVIADLNPLLMHTYRMIRSLPRAVHDATFELTKWCTSRRAYLMLRDNQPLHPVNKAARFLCLQATSFNGLWRENAAGQHNVPWSHRTRPPHYGIAQLSVASRKMYGAEMVCDDALSVMANASRGDVVYVDPPYAGTFTSYNGGTWTPLHLAELASECFRLARRGVCVIASDADNQTTRALYKGARIEPVNVRQSIAASAAARGGRREILVTFPMGRK